MNTRNHKSSVQAVDRALQIIDELTEEIDGLSVTALADRMGLAKSTIHRLLTSLKNKGYVQQDAVTEKYQLGVKFIEIGSVISRSLEINRIAPPFMKQLVEETGETAHLVILQEGEIIYIEKTESPSYLRMYSMVGKRAPAHCTGAGKAILAHLTEAQVEQIIAEKGLKQYTPSTIVTKQKLMAQLQETRKRGYAIDNEEHEPGIRCVAAAIFNHHADVVASLSVAGPTIRMDEEKMNFCAGKVKHYANAISERLGYRA